MPPFAPHFPCPSSTAAVADCLCMRRAQLRASGDSAPWLLEVLRCSRCHITCRHALQHLACTPACTLTPPGPSRGRATINNTWLPATKRALLLLLVMPRAAACARAAAPRVPRRATATPRLRPSVCCVAPRPTCSAPIVCCVPPPPARPNGLKRPKCLPASSARPPVQVCAAESLLQVLDPSPFPPPQPPAQSLGSWEARRCLTPAPSQGTPIHPHTPEGPALQTGAFQHHPTHLGILRNSNTRAGSGLV
jgi:hypothetical protein